MANVDSAALWRDLLCLFVFLGCVLRPIDSEVV